MEKKYCNLCQFAYVGGCPKHQAKQPEAEPRVTKTTVSVSNGDMPVQKPSLLQRIKSKLTRK